MSSDPFSDVLALVETSTVITNALATGGSWAFRYKPPGKIKVYVVAKGTAWLKIDGEKQAVKLEQGDVFVLTGERGFFLGSALNVPGRDVCPTFERGGVFAQVGNGQDGMLIGGCVAVKDGQLLTEAFPVFFHARGTAPETAHLRWLIDRLREESSSQLPGASIACAHLAELVFIHVLREHRTAQPGWLRAINDERIHRAVRAMHGDPARAWRLNELAKTASMSRASFVMRFKMVAGVTPLVYLAEWRMRLARRHLRDGDMPIVDVATSVGYATESAFSHAFKRITGSAPRAYRKLSRSNTSLGL